MQIKVFTIPMVGGEEQYTEMNVFLRSKKILKVENYIVNDAELLRRKPQSEDYKKAFVELNGKLD